MSPNTSEPMVGPPASGRIFETSRRVSIDDTAPSGRMEFDAIARFLQDAGNDDTDDAGLHELGLAWVARRTVIDVERFPTSRELLHIATWCSGTGSRWAARRTRLRGDEGGAIDAEAIWIHVDTATGKPVPWGNEFAASYLEAAGGRTVRARLTHDPLPDDRTDLERLDFRFRSTDMDGFGHVNNAAYLAVLEELLDEPATPVRVEIEWRHASVAGEPLVARHRSGPAGTDLWLVDTDDELRVTIRRSQLDGVRD